MVSFESCRVSTRGCTRLDHFFRDTGQISPEPTCRGGGIGHNVPIPIFRGTAGIGMGPGPPRINGALWIEKGIGYRPVKPVRNAPHLQVFDMSRIRQGHPGLRVPPETAPVQVC